MTDAIEVFPSNSKERITEVQTTLLNEEVAYATKTTALELVEEIEPEAIFTVDPKEDDPEARVSQTINEIKEDLSAEADTNVKKIIQKVKKTYSQHWHEYNLAQTNEKNFVLALLEELLDSFEDALILDQRPRVGRPQIPLKEKIYCMTLYEYFGFSARRTVSDFELSRRAGIISRKYHYNSILNGFNDPRITKILDELITITALPLRIVERDFAIDSSGFSTSRFEQWFNIRTQKDQKIRQWKKMHVIIGTKTQVVTSVKITAGTSPDCPELIPLAEQTHQFFTMENFTADKAYLSRENLQIIASLGAMPFIPFKSNSARAQKGYPIWGVMWKMFHENQDVFMENYHRRSLVESFFGATKKKLGGHLKTLNDTSQVNELLLKCLIHNLIVLVHAMIELGIPVDLNYCADEFYTHKYP